ncbi:M48 family metallopeptidase [Luteimonas sp. e5]
MHSTPDSTSASDSLPALWSDGRSSRVHPVRLACREGQLHVDAGAQGRQAWSLAQVRISPRLARSVRSLALPDGGRIEVADAPLLDHWFPRPPSRVEALADWLERRRYAIVTAALLTVAVVVAAVQLGVPWAAQRVAERMPEGIERSSSDQVVRLLARALKPSRLPEPRQEALQTAFRQLVEGEPRAAQMRLHVVDAPVIGPNAFALPDGRIYLTDQLVELAANDDEVLAVLAHEAGHHVHRHGMRNAIENSSVFLLAGLLLGDVSGSSLAVALPATLLSRRFSRGHEREADAYAFDLLRRRGRSPADFANLMERLTRQDGDDDSADDVMPGYLSTHPSTAARIRAAREAGR